MQFVMPDKAGLVYLALSPGSRVCNARRESELTLSAVDSSSHALQRSSALCTSAHSVHASALASAVCRYDKFRQLDVQQSRRSVGLHAHHLQLEESVVEARGECDQRPLVTQNLLAARDTP